MELILKYFPLLTDLQIQQFSRLEVLYTEWNEKINVISRKDIASLYLHHVLHSLAIAKAMPFEKNISVIDVGTGGGFPGIPLAIMFPEVRFTLLDATAKKIRVVNEIENAVGLENVTAVHTRAEEYEGQYDIVVTRAVSTLGQIVDWTKHLVPSGHWVALKGGDIREIRKELPPLYSMKFVPVTDFFSESYFTDKFVIDIQKRNS